ncbi:MAG TPA: NnrS family protein, partial [Candidatus Polarisedimenticolia bacterium]|nr:NnrS family protein [Candidatus Polarisedimenticolia bacterium]
GMFIGLVVGVGGMVLPLVTRGEAVADAATTGRDHLVRAGHLLAAIALAASFWIEDRVSQSGGLAMRAGVTLAVLLIAGKIYRLPVVPGWHRRLVWISAWMIPSGYALAALYPIQMKAGLHVVFIGGFALMAFSVGLHVTLAHGGYTRLASGRPWQVPVFSGLMLAAMVMRALCDFDRARFFHWLGAAAAAFLLSTVAWGWLVVPRLLRSPRPDERGAGAV